MEDTHFSKKLSAIWQNYLTNGQASTPHEDLRRVQFVTLFTLVGIPTFFVFGIYNVLLNDVVSGVTEIAVGALVVVNILLFRWRKSLELATSIMLAVVLYAVFFLLWRGGIANTGPYWFAVFPAMAFFLKEKQEGVIWTIGLVLGLCAAILLQQVDLIALPFSGTALRQLLASTIVISALLYLYASINTKNEQRIIDRERELQHTNRRLAHEIREHRQTESDLRDALRSLAHSKEEATKALKAAEDEREKFQFQVWETRKFASAVASSTDGIIMTTPEGIIVYVNPAWERMTGYAFDEVLGANPRILKSGLTPERVYQNMWASIKNRKTFHSEEIVNKRKDGTTYEAAISVFPIGEGNETAFYVGLEQDITHRKAVDRAKTEFVSLASHQLRTPLSSIGWYTEMLLHGDAGKLNKGQKSYLEEIAHGNARMIELVNALLNASRIELGTMAVEPTPTNIGELVNDVLRELKPQIEEAQHKLVLHIQSTMPPVSVDPKIMRMVFQNLLTNAVKYTPKKGVITVTLEQQADDIHFSVEDTGIGIPRSEQGKIYQKLFRADNARHKNTDGTGLGLYLAKAIVEQSGGRIWFSSPGGSTAGEESAENPGTTFHITLPKKGMPKKEGSRPVAV